MGVNWRKVYDDDACTYRQLVREFTDNAVLDGSTVADIEEYVTMQSYSMVRTAELSLPRKRYRPFLKTCWKSGNVKTARC